MKSGYCCFENEDCPKANICSFDNPGAPAEFKYLTWPNEANCGRKEINLEYTQDKKVVSLNDHVEQDDVCSYIISPPPEMGQSDRLHL
jgi:hypothetical protein